MAINTLIEIAATVGALLTTLFLIHKFIRPIFVSIQHAIKAFHQFLIDWAGEEARPGRDATPGVMERLNAIDGQLKNNGGSTIKDAVDRIERSVNRIDDRLAEGEKEFNEIHDEIDSIMHVVERREGQESIHFPDRRKRRFTYFAYYDADPTPEQ